ncbi:FecR family protein [Kordiimonas sp.]|uniref:FecR family protein n=1 Tax=Kordiimonas sp. TaxID=1970157 RepID=UPI003A8E795A
MSDKKISEAVLEQAADYYLGLQDGTISGAELHAWQEWLLAEEEHRRAFSRLETLWGVLETATAEDIAALPAPDLAESHTPGGSVLSMVAPNASRTRATPRFNVGWMGAMAASVAAALIAVYVVLSGSEAPEAPLVQTYETAHSERRAVDLADGSIIELNAGSAIAVAYTEAERRITLERGQAIFTVAKNPKRPFVVRAGFGSVTAVGTVFNVRKTGGDVEVQVLEGTVAVRPRADADATRGSETASSVALVTAGRQTSYSMGGTLAPVVANNITDLGWRTGVLTMVDLPISDVINRLNRYLASEITIGDEAVGQLRFTGTVYPDQVQAWLEGLEQGYPIDVVHLGNSTILMMASDSSDTVIR